MKTSQFIVNLGIITLLSVVFIFGLNYHPKMLSAQILSWSTISIFVVLSGMVYFFGAYAAKQKNKNTFTSLVLLVMMAKMFLCVLIVAIYVKTYEPTNNFFLIPFFSIYLIYTIFEVYIMTRLGKSD